MACTLPWTCFIRVERFGWPRPGAFFPRREPRAKWPRAVRIRRPANRTSVLGALERDNHIHKQNREREGTISNTHAWPKVERNGSERDGPVSKFVTWQSATSSTPVASPPRPRCHLRAPAWIVDRTVLVALVAVSAQLYSLVIECSRRTTVVSAAAAAAVGWEEFLVASWLYWRLLPRVRVHPEFKCAEWFMVIEVP